MPDSPGMRETLAPRPSVLIVGAGFSGTALAANLLRLGRPVRVLLTNRYGPMGRGVAYGTRLETHVLNVPAGQMSAFPDDPEGFLRFAREQDTAITAATFVPRRLYGEYLERVLADAEAAAAPGASLERMVGEAHAIAILPDGSGGEAVFRDGRRIAADRVVLALGNYSPADPPLADTTFFASPRYVRDPWVRGALDAIGAEDPVLMIGTGLTMLDIVLDLRARGCRGPMLAVSRHGLLPRPHLSGGPPRPPAALPKPLASAEALTVRGLVRAVRQSVAAHAAQGGDWREVVGALRPVTPELWRRLNPAERLRFLRHVRPYWDVHRHRAAPESAAAIASLLEAGHLTVRAGRILSLEDSVGVVDARVRPRGGVDVERIRVARVVNCTGPSSDARRIEDPLIVSLRSRGTVRPDALGLGLDVGDDGALYDASGRLSPVLFLMGPLLKARDWESTAVPELRAHAARLANRLLSS